jgi:hypothetical protein
MFILQYIYIHTGWWFGHILHIFQDDPHMIHRCPFLIGWLINRGV